ncbi:MAG TPA: hypothetical protein VHG08_16615 [Longimicrobium sp.]|nr:hypothetical protein [Longimicrobium sp.]
MAVHHGPCLAPAAGRSAPASDVVAARIRERLAETARDEVAAG